MHLAQLGTVSIKVHLPVPHSAMHRASSPSELQLASMRANLLMCAAALQPKPSASFEPKDVVYSCMEALQQSDCSAHEYGQQLTWEFAGGMMRGIFGGDYAEYVKWTRSNPTFQCMVNCKSFSIDEDTLQLLPGSETRGAMAKLVVSVEPQMSAMEALPPAPRRFLWTLQQERRPPLIGCWLVYQVLAVDRAIELTV